MADEERDRRAEAETRKGYHPQRERGYQPGQDSLDPNDPPQGGSGVPLKPETRKKPVRRRSATRR